MSDRAQVLAVTADVLRELGLETLAKLTEADVDEPLKEVLDCIWFLYDDGGFEDESCFFCQRRLHRKKSQDRFVAMLGHAPGCSWAKVGGIADPAFAKAEAAFHASRFKSSKRVRGYKDFVGTYPCTSCAADGVRRMVRVYGWLPDAVMCAQHRREELKATQREHGPTKRTEPREP